MAFGGLFASAQNTDMKVRGHASDPEVYFLNEGDLPNSLELLPPPPDPMSVTFLVDRARYEWGKSMRNTERGEQAYQDSKLGGDGVPRAFSEAFGVEISKENTPEIYKLVVGMREDAGDLATRDAKVHYMRTRPYIYFNDHTCNPEDEKNLSTNGSYPSGHTSIGWATALVLTEVNPERQNEILDRGFEMGESRVICGYHYQSDVDAGRLTGAVAVARLHADEGFNKQLEKAKKEFARLKKEGKVAPPPAK
ncbi:MAG: phosphatase PAP2 family protein [Muribaculaceae bacterium]|nr:phosphatase PAP2 family protein [Muribaculaceae bacterium]MDE6753517.1 phosphatase PAP2 family protein [Muribaculaceae bacterium]